METSEPIIITQSFTNELEEVWTAITQVSQMKQWYFENISDFQPKVGFETAFLVETEERTFPHHWSVVEVVPLRKLSYEWTFDGYQGKSITHWELHKKANQTVLTLTSEVIEPFPNDIPEFERASGVAGWEFFIQDRLKSYLENKES